MITCGANPNDVAAGWNKLGFWSSLVWNKASFNVVRGEIDGNYPFMSGAGGHVRALIGYMWSSSGEYGLINDPWPVGQGRQYYENRASSPENAYLLVH